MRRFALGCLFTLLIVEFGAFSQQPEKWFYAYVTLEKEGGFKDSDLSFGTDEFINEVLPKLSNNNYTKVVLSNYMLGSVKELSKDNSLLAENLKRLTLAADKKGIQIIPEVMSIGPSGTLLQDNPNLAEGVPVKSAKFKVVKRNGLLIAKIAASRNRIQGGNLDANLDKIRETFQVKNPGGVISQSKADNEIGNDNVLQLSPANDDESAYFELSQSNIKLKPNRQYRLSFKVKTKEAYPVSEGKNALGIYIKLKSTIEGECYRMNHSSFEIEHSSTWQTFYATFNSFAANSVHLNLFFDELFSGTIWVDDLILQEVGGVNLLRRHDLPLVVKGRNGKEYKEGEDFEWKDSDVGMYGNYIHDEDAPPIKIKGDQIKAGDILDVSYYHAIIPGNKGGQVCASLSSREVLKHLQQQVRLINSILSDVPPKAWYVNHDEIRSCGHEPNSFPAGTENIPGLLLAKFYGECKNILSKEVPGTELILCSDMYDPNHNAGAKNSEESFFPLNNGTFHGSWEPLAETPNLVAWNWSLGEIRELDEGLGIVLKSFKHFDRLREDDPVPQIIGGFYDVNFDDDDQAQTKLKSRTRQHFQAAKANGNVRGVCYYTNEKDLSHLADFSKIADEIFDN